MDLSVEMTGPGSARDRAGGKSSARLPMATLVWSVGDDGYGGDQEKEEAEKEKAKNRAGKRTYWHPSRKEVRETYIEGSGIPGQAEKGNVPSRRRGSLRRHGGRAMITICSYSGLRWWASCKMPVSRAL